MSLRAHNRKRITTAAEAARRANEWIGVRLAQSQAERMLPAELPAAARDRFLNHPRMQHRLANNLPGLFDLFLDHPELGPWLQSPDKLERLALLIGCQRHGAKLKPFVMRDDVAEIIETVGRDGYELACSQPDNPMSLDQRPTPVLEAIAEDGERVAKAYMAQKMQDRFPDIAAVLLPDVEAPDLAEDVQQSVSELISKVSAT